MAGIDPQFFVLGDLSLISFLSNLFPSRLENIFVQRRKMSSHLGIEPRTFGLEVQRAIRCANGTPLNVPTQQIYQSKITTVPIFYTSFLFTFGYNPRNSS